MNTQKLLINVLEAYGKTDTYPFHMPGHKRQEEMGITSFPNPFTVDISEIEGFDNLHHAEGILKESMDHAAGVYGSDRTFYLVNGSTCGILSALCGTVRKRGSFIMARNSHKSAYHAVQLGEYSPVYVYPDYVEEYGIQGKISPEDIEGLLREYQGIEAVYITSPTYEGIVSDIGKIAAAAHRYSVPLIVDEAHGAHLSFGGDGLFPRSALDCGADIVVQSLHKTLPSLTQTALLHIKSSLIKPEKIEQYLHIFESSSPSYVFMASIENCIHFMETEGAGRLREHGYRMRNLMKVCAGLKNLKLMDKAENGGGALDGRDISKILISTKNTGMTGVELSEILRVKYHLEPEMSCQSYVLLMTSLMDREEGIERLIHALFMTDALCEGSTGSEAGGQEYLTWIRNPEISMSLSDAVEADKEMVELKSAAGRISGGFLTVYPPGIPALASGERITEEAVSMIGYHIKAGLTVEGISENLKVPVVLEKTQG